MGTVLPAWLLHLLAWARWSLAWPIKPSQSRANRFCHLQRRRTARFQRQRQVLHQVVNNTSALANDRTNPTITGSPSINPDGNSFQLKFSEDISKDSLTSFDTNQFKLFVDGVEQTAGSFSIDPSQFDGPLGDAGAPAADVPINEVTVQINGSTIEVGQNVLLSYAINDPNGSTGITDTSGNNLANFTYQLENFSAQVSNTPPIIASGGIQDLVVLEDSAARNLGLASVIYSPGKENEQNQDLSYVVTSIPEGQLGNIKYRQW